MLKPEKLIQARARHGYKCLNISKMVNFWPGQFNIHEEAQLTS